jgi:hypothetical protein
MRIKAGKIDRRNYQKTIAIRGMRPARQEERKYFFFEKKKQKTFIR